MSTITTWDELTTKQAKETAEHMSGYKDAFDRFQTGKKAILKAINCSEAELPSDIKEKFKLDEEGFKNEWGLVYGRRDKALRFQHQKEIDIYFATQLELDKVKERHAKTPEKEKVR